MRALLDVVRSPGVCLSVLLPLVAAAADLRSVPAFFAPERNGFVSYGSRVPVRAAAGAIELGGLTLVHVGGVLGIPIPDDTGGEFRSYSGATLASGPIASSVLYREIQPGIDLRLSFENNTFKTDYLLAAGANPAGIWLRFVGGRTAVADDGNLQVRGPDGKGFVLPRPYAYQMRKKERRSIRASYVRGKTGDIGFALGPYDRKLPLIIDPYIVTSALLTGGSGIDKVFALTLDSAGNVHLAGSTESPNYSPLATAQGADAFVVKMNSSNQITWATYLRGSTYDAASAMVLDASGSVYVAGYSTSSDFVVQPAGATVLAGGRDAFLAKLDANGAIQFSTLLGGAGSDEANAITLSPTGEIWIAGDTASANFPRSNAYQPTSAGGIDAFVARYSSTGNRLSTTFLGGSGDDIATAIAVDSSGVYLTGSTTSPNFPTASPAFAANAGLQDAFVTRMNTSATSLIYSTYLGGGDGRPGQVETGNALKLDDSGNAYVVGTTSSVNFPLVNALQGYSGGATDIFAAKLSSTGSLLFSTYLGGAGADEALALALQTDGSIYIAGTTTSSDLPPVDAIQSTLSSTGKQDGLLIRLASNLSQIILQTYLGGSDGDAVTGMGLSGTNIYLAGYSSSPSLLSLTTSKGSVDGFTIRLQERPVSLLLSTNSSGTKFTVAGTGCSAGTYTDFANLSWTVNSICTVSVTSPQSTSVGVRRIFSSWNDSSVLNPRSWLASSTVGNMSMLFSTAYLLTRNAGTGGAIGVNVASADGFYASGTQVQLSASPSTGYQFTGWSGDISGTANPVSITMFTARTVNASFACSPQVSTTSVSLGNAASSTAVAITTGSGCSYNSSTTASWITITSGGSGTGSGTVQLALAANGTNAVRSGSVIVGGIAVTVSQGAIQDYPVTITTSPAGLPFSVTGTNCAAGSYTTPASLTWRIASSCTIIMSGSQTIDGVAYTFSSWQDASVGNPRTFTVAGAAIYTATYAAPDYPVVLTTSPAGLTYSVSGSNCLGGTYTGAVTLFWRHGTTCIVTLASVQTLNTVPYSFAGWTDGNAVNPRTFSVTGAASYTASFVLPDYATNLSLSPAAVFTVSGVNCTPGTYTGQAALAWKHGATCTVSVSSPQVVGGTPYSFALWSDGIATNPRTFQVTSGVTLLGSLTLPDYATAISTSVAGLQFSVGGANCTPGTYTSSAGLNFRHGAVCSISVPSPQGPYNFVGWQDGSAANPRSVSVLGAATYTAAFNLTSYPVTFSTSPQGLSFSVSGAGCSPGTYSGPATLTMQHGATCVVAASGTQTLAGTLYNFSGWSDGQSVNPRSIVATGAGAFTLTYSLGSHPVQLSTSPQGLHISVSGVGCLPGTYVAPVTLNWPKGSTCTFSVSADEMLERQGYSFYAWEDGVNTPQRSVVVTGPMSYTAGYLAYTPDVKTLSPLVGSGVSGTYRAIFTHSGGATQHYLGYILFLPTPNVVSYTAKGSCLVEYNRISNGIRLINDAGDNWLGPPEGVAAKPGAAVLSNSQCSVNPATVSVVFNGNDMEVSLSLAFKSTYAGVLATFLQEQDVNGSWTGMTQFGNWLVAPLGTPRSGPYIVSGGPANGAGSSTTIAFTTGHTSGIGSNSLVTILISSKVVGGAPCQLFFFPLDNSVNMVNDIGALASPTNVRLGTAVTLSNSRCSLNVGGMARLDSGNTVTATFPVTFNPSTFGGAKNLYGNAFDVTGLLTHWVQFGNWTVQ